MVERGDQAKDTITGFKGIVMGKTSWLNGCVRITLQPTINKDGTLPEAEEFDIEQISVIKKGVVPAQKSKAMTLALGDQVKDTLSGFKGTVCAITEWLNGNVGVTAQPKIKKDGTLSNTATISIERFHVTKKKTVKKKKPSGGPTPKAKPLL